MTRSTNEGPISPKISPSRTPNDTSVSATTGEEQTLSLPVLDGTLEEYAHLLP